MKTSTNETDIILSKYPREKDQMLLILHELQKASADSCITEEMMEAVSKHLCISKSTVYGVVTYYSMLSKNERQKNIISVCVSPVCKMKGSDKTFQILSKISKEENLPFSLEKCECLGYCDHAPAFSINNKLFSETTKAKLKKIIKHFDE